VKAQIYAILTLVPDRKPALVQISPVPRMYSGNTREVTSKKRELLNM